MISLARRQHRARELRVGRAIPAPPGDGRERTEDHTLDCRRRTSEHDDVAELLREERELQQGGMPLALVCPRRASPNSVSITWEKLAWYGLYPHPGVPVAGVPPVVPFAGLDNAGLSLVEDARVAVPADGQLTLKDGEALGHCWVAVLADNAGSDEGSEFGYARRSGFFHGSSRIVARSPVTGFG